MGKPKGESRGLEYLKQVRPAAVEHLLKFFGESGKHLEPKTRFLISIVTKVINFSPRGLEQYVKRALKEGATLDEILDAVLCAYPCAGLTRVVDAVDVILDLGLGELSSPPAPATSAPEPRWVRVADAAELEVGQALHVQAGAFEIAVFNVQGRLVAIDHLCPHKQGPLANGLVAASADGSSAVVSCPLHNWKFDLSSGESVNHPGARVRTYSVRLSHNDIEVLIPS